MSRIYVLFLLCALLPAAAFPCSVCGCDPSGGNLGLDRPTSGDLRLAVDDRYLYKESGTVDDGTFEGEREDRLNLRVQYAPPVPRLSFQLDVPIYLWKAHRGLDDTIDDTSRGLSDITLGARYELLHLDGLRHVVAVTAAAKAPTGDNNHLAPVDDGVFDEHKQVGTGTWDGFFGLWYTYGDFPTVAYAGVTARVNGTNARGNHYGNALFGTLGVRRSFLESRHLYLSLDAQVRNAGKDTTPDGVYDDNSGGFLAYGVASAGYALTSSLLLRAIVQVPVVKALYGAQGEHPVGFLALAYDLSL